MTPEIWFLVGLCGIGLYVMYLAWEGFKVESARDSVESATRAHNANLNVKESLNELRAEIKKARTLHGR